MAHKDLTGRRFGMLIAARYIGASRWECKCDCGRNAIVNAYNLKSGHSKSCGCMRGKNHSHIHKHTKETREKMSRSAKKRGMPESVRCKGVAAKAQTAGGGRFETNRNAKEWTLISPSGEEYTVSNLLLFIREHASQFGIDASNDEETHYILQRFSMLKRNMRLGKQKSCCRGWKIIIPEDDRINKYK